MTISQEIDRGLNKATETIKKVFGIENRPPIRPEVQAAADGIGEARRRGVDLFKNFFGRVDRETELAAEQGRLEKEAAGLMNRHDNEIKLQQAQERLRREMRIPGRTLTKAEEGVMLEVHPNATLIKVSETREAAQKKAAERVSNRGMSSEPVAMDVKLKADVEIRENRRLAYGVEMGQAIRAELTDIGATGSDGIRAELIKLRKISQTLLEPAKAMREEAIEGGRAIAALAEREAARTGHYEVARGEAKKYQGEIVRAMTPAKVEMVDRAEKLSYVDVTVGIGRMYNMFLDAGVTPTNQMMAELGVVKVKDKDGKERYAIRPDSVAARWQMSETNYRAVTVELRRTMMDVGTNPDRAYSAFILAEGARAQGAAFVTADNAIRQQVAEAARKEIERTQQARIAASARAEGARQSANLAKGDWLDRLIVGVDMVWKIVSGSGKAMNEAMIKQMQQQEAEELNATVQLAEAEEQKRKKLAAFQKAV